MITLKTWGAYPGSSGWAERWMASGHQGAWVSPWTRPPDQEPLPLLCAPPSAGRVPACRAFPSAAASPLPSPRQSQKMGKWWTRALGGGTSEPGSPRHGLTVPNQALAPLSSTQRLTGNFHSALLARRGRGQSYNGDGPCVFPLVSRPVALNAPWTSQGLGTGTAEHTRPSLTP